MSQGQKREGYVGQPMDRVDGRLKVAGTAKFAAEFDAPNLAHAVLIQSTIAHGKIVTMDTAEARRHPGVIAVITAENMPHMARPTAPPSGETTPIFDKTIHYSGQSVGVVVAETIEAAEHGAELVKIRYEAGTPEIDLEAMQGQAYTPKSSNRPPTSKRGDFDKGMAAASHKIEHTYRTPIEHHNPMEPHATMAVWSGKTLTAYDATQGVVNSAQNLAELFDLLPEDVRVVDPFVGGGFGCKGQSWLHVPIAAMAAKLVGRPVKLALTRKQMFTSNGHRPPTLQALAIGTGDDGKLTAARNHVINHTARLDEFMEPSGMQTSTTYSCPNVDVAHQLVRMDVGPPTYQRAPGEASGSFSIETAMDELAHELGVDPVELRLRNYAEKDEAEKKPYSSKSLRECYRLGAEAFGWAKRNPAIGAMREGRYLVGYGMATATYPANFRPASAKAIIYRDGRIRILCATQDLGTGTYTILLQIAADAAGATPDMVQVEIGDSHLPSAPGSGGSCTATSAGSAVQAAAEALRSRLVGYAISLEGSPVSGLSSKEVEAKNGIVRSKADPSRSISFAKIMEGTGKAVVEQEAFVKPGIERGSSGGGSPTLQGGSEQPQGQGYTMQAFGSHFCEVHVDPELRMVRVSRWVGAFAVGKILNRKTLTSQLKGGIVWGIGMGLLEETLPDSRYGRYVNTNLAEYHVPVNADVGPIEILLVDEEDKFVSPLGAKGAGEIGICGAAAAIGNAIFHATGKRVRDLPITLDKLF